jgi:hypothetical protein
MEASSRQALGMLDLPCEIEPQIVDCEAMRGCTLHESCPNVVFTSRFARLALSIPVRRLSMKGLRPGRQATSTEMVEYACVAMA